MILDTIGAVAKAIGTFLGLIDKAVDFEKTREAKNQGRVEQVATDQSKALQDVKKANDARAASERDSDAGKLHESDGFKRQ